ncbi:MAG: hypothetical protein IJM50_01015 [Lachnospiraceae bacterium]|nr:hypothetical protein [Lachnospiraceae bacterium]
MSKFKRFIDHNLRDGFEKAFFWGIVLAVALVLLLFFKTRTDNDSYMDLITALTAVIAGMTFWLEFRRSGHISEADFIQEMNSHFISDDNMMDVEHALELYYDDYRTLSKEKLFIQDYSADTEDARDGSAEKPERIQFFLKNEIEKHRKKVKEHINLDVKLSIRERDHQKLINYLVYLEGLAALVHRGVLHFEEINNLFAYRFFLAVNNPMVQESELFPYKRFYQGIYELSEKWTKEFVSKKCDEMKKDYNKAIHNLKKESRENMKKEKSLLKENYNKAIQNLKKGSLERRINIEDIPMYEFELTAAYETWLKEEKAKEQAAEKQEDQNK